MTDTFAVGSPLLDCLLVEHVPEKVKVSVDDKPSAGEDTSSTEAAATSTSAAGSTATATASSSATESASTNEAIAQQQAIDAAAQEALARQQPDDSTQGTQRELETTSTHTITGAATSQPPNAAELEAFRLWQQQQQQEYVSASAAGFPASAAVHGDQQVGFYGAGNSNGTDFRLLSQVLYEQNQKKQEVEVEQAKAQSEQAKAQSEQAKAQSEQAKALREQAHIIGQALSLAANGQSSNSTNKTSEVPQTTNSNNDDRLTKADMHGLENRLLDRMQGIDTNVKALTEKKNNTPGSAHPLKDLRRRPIGLGVPPSNLGSAFAATTTSPTAATAGGDAGNEATATASEEQMVETAVAFSPSDDSSVESFHSVNSQPSPDRSVEEKEAIVEAPFDDSGSISVDEEDVQVKPCKEVRFAGTPSGPRRFGCFAGKVVSVLSSPFRPKTAEPPSSPEDSLAQSPGGTNHSDTESQDTAQEEAEEDSVDNNSEGGDAARNGEELAIVAGNSENGVTASDGDDLARLGDNSDGKVAKKKKRTADRQIRKEDDSDSGEEEDVRFFGKADESVLKRRKMVKGNRRRPAGSAVSAKYGSTNAFANWGGFVTGGASGGGVASATSEETKVVANDKDAPIWSGAPSFTGGFGSSATSNEDGSASVTTSTGFGSGTKYKGLRTAAVTRDDFGFGSAANTASTSTGNDGNTSTTTATAGTTKNLFDTKSTAAPSFGFGSSFTTTTPTPNATATCSSTTEEDTKEAPTKLPAVKLPDQVTGEEEEHVLFLKRAKVYELVEDIAVNVKEDATTTQQAAAPCVAPSSTNLFANANKGPDAADDTSNNNNNNCGGDDSNAKASENSIDATAAASPDNGPKKCWKGLGVGPLKLLEGGPNTYRLVQRYQGKNPGDKAGRVLLNEPFWGEADIVKQDDKSIQLTLPPLKTFLFKFKGNKEALAFFTVLMEHKTKAKFFFETGGASGSGVAATTAASSSTTKEAPTGKLPATVKVPDQVKITGTTIASSSTTKEASDNTKEAPTDKLPATVEVPDQVNITATTTASSSSSKEASEKTKEAPTAKITDKNYDNAGAAAENGEAAFDEKHENAADQPLIDASGDIDEPATGRAAPAPNMIQNEAPELVAETNVAASGNYIFDMCKYITATGCNLAKKWRTDPNGEECPHCGNNEHKLCGQHRNVVKADLAKHCEDCRPKKLCEKHSEDLEAFLASRVRNDGE